MKWYYYCVFVGLLVIAVVLVIVATRDNSDSQSVPAGEEDIEVVPVVNDDNQSVPVEENKSVSNQTVVAENNSNNSRPARRPGGGGGGSSSSGGGSSSGGSSGETPLNVQYFGFSSLSNFTSPEDTAASLEIARANSDYILIISKVNWSEYYDGWENKSDAKFEELEVWKIIADYYGLKLYVMIDVLESRDRKLIDQSIPWADKSFANSNVRSAIKNYAKKVATNITPDYLTIGMEINTYASSHPEDFANFVSLFDESYSFVKSSNIKVGPTIQYEQMTNCSNEGDQYSLLGNFSNADFIGISTYPRICFESFANVPADYYSRISQHTQKPLIIGESGWPTNSSTFPSTEQDQKQYLSFLLSESNKMKMDLVIWWFMHDCYDPVCLNGYDENQFFISSGILKSDGGAKEAWAEWQSNYVKIKNLNRQ